MKQPRNIEAGDTVRARYKPKWGEGVVIDAVHLGSFDIGTGPDKTTIRYQQNATGQRVSVRFADGRTRTVLTPMEPLEIVSLPKRKVRTNK